MIRDWAKRKFITPVREVIKKGISREKLAVSLTLGIIVGLIPFYGLTTLIVGALALSLRLNMVIMQVVHYIVHPIQIALIIPFMKLGDSVLNRSEVDFTVGEYIALFKGDFGNAISELWLVNLSAIAMWGLLSVPMFFALYYSFLYSMKRFNLVRIR